MYLGMNVQHLRHTCVVCILYREAYAVWTSVPRLWSQTTPGTCPHSVLRRLVQSKSTKDDFLISAIFFRSFSHIVLFQNLDKNVVSHVYPLSNTFLFLLQIKEISTPKFILI